MSGRGYGVKNGRGYGVTMVGTELLGQLKTSVINKVKLAVVVFLYCEVDVVNFSVFKLSEQ